MELLLAVVIGVLYATGIYMIMRRSIMKLIIGIGLLAHGADLLIFTLGRIESTKPPIIAAGEESITNYADPVPQALILTAIVIGFGVMAFALVLFRETVRVSDTGDVQEMRLSDR
ncbi:MAG: Na+/H+ antiporter subunit C [Anaerolineae bacterium]|nr:Na+/H+ antiporter subunit C [Anaerolineae bacterium]MCO5191106.1 Na+/H+ antiporter subunit C [Anaerolineae bacterium]MCO5193712.1 Na+/H+ antiporter subunit C [Anaerolineae bacterium]MCO5196701.1 Na+/H+ antiporter subunit C [Anaerolineae bacterium]MCO5206807.1 Na+/H+ antiporter subunit C [Anaerolineae bacterium]